MGYIKCKCGSTDCTKLEWSKAKEGAKKGGLGGALAGALIGLAGGPIGAIAGAAIGAAGGAAIGKDQPKDGKGRFIERYKCNSCNKKFEVCPECMNRLVCFSKYSKNGNITTTKNYCLNCQNFISSSTKTAQPANNKGPNPAAGAAVNWYVNKVKDNLNSFNDYDD